MVERVVVDLHLARQPALVGERLLDHAAYVVVGERLQRQQQRAGEQRRDHREEGVLGGRGHERDPPVLHAGQQRVLLRLGEAVDLVDEEHRLLPRARQPLARTLDRGAHLLHARRHRRDLDELPVGLAAQHRGDGRLASAGRTPQQQRHRLVGLDQPAQRRAGLQQVLLAHQLLEGARTHPHGERRRAVVVARQRPAGGRRRPGLVVLEEAVHHLATLRTRPPGAYARPAGAYARPAGAYVRTSAGSACTRAGSACTRAGSTCTSAGSACTSAGSACRSGGVRRLRPAR